MESTVVVCKIGIAIVCPLNKFGSALIRKVSYQQYFFLVSLSLSPSHFLVLEQKLFCEFAVITPMFAFCVLLCEFFDLAKGILFHVAPIAILLLFGGRGEAH